MRGVDRTKTSFLFVVKLIVTDNCPPQCFLFVLGGLLLREEINDNNISNNDNIYMYDTN